MFMLLLDQRHMFLLVSVQKTKKADVNLPRNVMIVEDDLFFYNKQNTMLVP